MRSWGQLPLNYIEAWKERKCDLVFTAERMGSRTLSYCPDLQNAGNSTAATVAKAKKTGTLFLLSNCHCTSDLLTTAAHFDICSLIVTIAFHLLL